MHAPTTVSSRRSAAFPPALEPRPTITALLGRAWRQNKPLTFTGVVMLTVLAGTLVGLVVDDQVITGAPAWLKPAKFAISLAIYAFTLLWLLTFVTGHRRLVAIVSWGTAATVMIEMIAIAGQVARGTTSHFNISSPFDTMVWATMGTAIVVLWLLALVTAVLLLRQGLPDAAFAWSLRLGVIIAVVGMALAFLMTSPRPEQMTAGAGTAGGHSVGVADGGPGLPVVGWSTTGGDLRVAHFIGLHGLQVLPLVGWLVASWPAPWLGRRDRVALVVIAGGAYLGLTLVLAWQALRGQPLTAPDSVTLATGGALLGLGAVAVAGVLLRARRRAVGAA